MEGEVREGSEEERRDERDEKKLEKGCTPFSEVQSRFAETLFAES